MGVFGNTCADIYNVLCCIRDYCINYVNGVLN